MAPEGQAKRGPAAEVTRLLAEWRGGRAGARDELIEMVYPRLRAMAARALRAERPDHTLQPTALVHEAYLRLVDQTRVEWRDRAHFFAVAAQAIRRVLVDHARALRADKRIGPQRKLPLEAAGELAVGPTVDTLDLDRALERLAALDPRQARAVELRFFAGLTVDETAAVLDVSPRSVARELAVARLWLRRELLAEGEDGG